MSKKPIGVLLMAYGGPDSLEDMAGYLADIRAGRPTGKAVLEEITRNYQQTGGKSPLLEISRQQIQGVEKILAQDSQPYRFYLGMRHWAPWIEETVRDMIADGIQRAVALVLAPHYSSMSVAKYLKKIEAGQQMFGGSIQFEWIKSYHTAPKYIEALANRVRDGIARWPQEQRTDVHVVMSAHSLPERILKMGDPYQDQLWETARLVAEKAGLTEGQWSWSYQSAGRSPEPWLGPQIQDHIVTLAEQGKRNIVSLPIGFVCDHVEIQYDIDIQAQAVAREHGIRLERPPSLNTDPLFVETLADLVRERATALA